MDDAAQREGQSPALGVFEGALAALERDHRELRRLFRRLLDELEGGADAEARARSLLELGRKLLSHTRAEEEVFFARMYRNPELRPSTDRCLDEHTELEVLLGHLADMEADDEAWDELVWTLGSSFELHARQEEQEVYPRAVAEIGAAEVDALVARYRACRARWAQHIDGDLGNGGPGPTPL